MARFYLCCLQTQNWDSFTFSADLELIFKHALYPLYLLNRKQLWIWKQMHCCINHDNMGFFYVETIQVPATRLHWRRCQASTVMVWLSAENALSTWSEANSETSSDCCHLKTRPRTRNIQECDKHFCCRRGREWNQTRNDGNPPWGMVHGVHQSRKNGSFLMGSPILSSKNCCIEQENHGKPIGFGVPTKSLRCTSSPGLHGHLHSCFSPDTPPLNTASITASCWKRTGRQIWSLQGCAPSYTLIYKQ